MGKAVFQTEIIELGEQVDAFFEEGMFVLFGENVPDVGMRFFPRQYFTVEVVGVKVSGQYIEFTRSLQEVVMYDSPVMFSFRRIFVIIDDDGHTFCFDGKTAMINIIQCHELIIFTVAILRILVGVGKKNQ